MSDPGTASYTQLADFDVDNSTDQLYNTTFGRHSLDLVMQNAAAAAHYPVGTRLTITEGTITDAAQRKS